MPTREEMLSFIRQKIEAMTPEARMALGQKVKARMYAKQHGIRALSTREGGYQYDPEHPELFRKDPARLWANMQSEMSAIGALNPLNPANPIGLGIAAALKGLLPSPPETYGYGGMEAGESQPGAVPRTSVTSPPLPRELYEGPKQVGQVVSTEDRRSAIRKVAEFLAGTAPADVVRAIKETPGGPFANPELALRRAHGAFAHRIEEAPLMTVAELSGAGELGTLGVKGAIRGVKGIVSTGRYIRAGKMLPKAAQTELEAAVNVPVETVAPLQGRTLDELKLMREQVETRITQEKQFPFATETTAYDRAKSEVDALRGLRAQVAKARKTKARTAQLTAIDAKIKSAEDALNQEVNKRLYGATPERVLRGSQVSNKIPEPSTTPPLDEAGKLVDDATPITIPVTASATGDVAFRTGPVRNFFMSIEKNVKSPLAQNIVSQFKRAFVDHHNMAGEEMARFSRISSRFGLDIKEEAVEAALGVKPVTGRANELLGRVQPIFKRIEEEIKGLADQGRPIMVPMPDGSWEPWRPRKDFVLPRKLDEEWTKAIWDDTKKAFRKLRVDLEGKTGNARVIQALDDLYAKTQEKLSAQTRKSIDHLIASHWVQSPGEAWAFLARRAYDDMYRQFGHIDAHRVPFFPKEAYSRNFDEVVTEYIYGASRRIAEARQFGGNGEILRGQLTKLAATNSDEAKYLRQVAENQFGESAKVFAQKNPTLKQIYDLYSEYSVATKIGLGTATIPNLTQFMISTVPVLGVGNTLKGAMRLVFDPAYREALRSTGITLQEVMQAFVQEEFHGKAGHLSNILLKPFVGANKIQKYLAAAAMDAAYDDIVRGAVTGNKTSLRMLNRLGIDISEAATPEARKRAIFRFAAESQLQREGVMEPLMFGNPAARPFILFKRFGFRQAKFIKDWVGVEARHGNYGPMLRLAASGWLGGELVREGKEHLREWLRGQPSYNPPKGFINRVLSNYADVGSLGVFSDLMRLDGVLPDVWINEIIDNAVFAASPMPITDIRGGIARTKEAVTEISRRGPVTGGRRVAGRFITSWMGSIPSNLSNRLKSEAQVRNEVMSRRNTRQQDVNGLIVRGDWSKAILVARDWNEKFGRYGEGYLVKMPADPKSLLRLYMNDEMRRRDLTPEQQEAILKTLNEPD